MSKMASFPIGKTVASLVAGVGTVCLGTMMTSPKTTSLMMSDSTPHPNTHTRTKSYNAFTRFVGKSVPSVVVRMN